MTQPSKKLIKRVVKLYEFAENKDKKSTHEYLKKVTETGEQDNSELYKAYLKDLEESYSSYLPDDLAYGVINMSCEMFIKECISRKLLIPVE